MSSLPIPDNGTQECDIVSRYPSNEIPMPGEWERMEPISAHNPDEWMRPGETELQYRIRRGMHRIIGITNMGATE